MESEVILSHASELSRTALLLLEFSEAKLCTVVSYFKLHQGNAILWVNDPE